MVNLSNLYLNVSNCKVNFDSFIKGKCNYRYQIRVKNKVINKTTSFMYNDSVYNYEKNIKVTNNDDSILFALRCFLMDSTCYLDTKDYKFNSDEKHLENFMIEFGYINSDEKHLLNCSSYEIRNYYSKEKQESIKAGRQAFLGCKDALRKFERVGIYESNIYSLLDELSEKGVE